MDFFEKLFGVSPDGGNGSLEMLFVVGLVAIALLITFIAIRHYRSVPSRF